MYNWCVINLSLQHVHSFGIAFGEEEILLSIHHSLKAASSSNVPFLLYIFTCLITSRQPSIGDVFILKIRKVFHVFPRQAIPLKDICNVHSGLMRAGVQYIYSLHWLICLSGIYLSRILTCHGRILSRINGGTTFLYCQHKQLLLKRALRIYFIVSLSAAENHICLIDKILSGIQSPLLDFIKMPSTRKMN